MLRPDNVLSVAADALEVILEIRDNEPGNDEFALMLEMTGVSGLQFVYELSSSASPYYEPGGHAH